MLRQVLVDTGPLVALINKSDAHHAWAVNEAAAIERPLFTCESVISEAHFLLGRIPNGREGLIGMLETQVIQVPFSFDEESNELCTLLKQYQSVPISVADACLVRMAELFPNSHIFTLDSDFRIYRKNGNQIIPVIMPM